MEVGLPEIIDVVMGVQLLVFSLFLFTNRKKYLPNLILGIFFLSEFFGTFNSLSFFQFGFFSRNYVNLFFVGLPFTFIWGPSFYFYVKSLTDKNFSLKKMDLLHLVPFLAAVIVLLSIFYFKDPISKRIMLRSDSFFFNKYRKEINTTLAFQLLLYNIKSLFILFKYRKGLKENYSNISKIKYSWLMYFIYGYSISYLISTSIQFIIPILGKHTNILIVIIYLSFFVFFNIIFLKGWRQPEIFAGIDVHEKNKVSRFSKEQTCYWLTQLNNLMKTAKPFLNPELTINGLADMLNINSKNLSTIINENFHKNFYDYINCIRIEESKVKLLDPANTKNISEIMYETGFNSKATFHRAFKKEIGLSPTEFKRKFKKPADDIL